MWSIESMAIEGLMSSSPVYIVAFSVAAVVVISHLEVGSKLREQEGGFGIKLAKGDIVIVREGPILIK